MDILFEIKEDKRLENKGGYTIKLSQSGEKIILETEYVFNYRRLVKNNNIISEIRKNNRTLILGYKLEIDLANCEYITTHTNINTVDGNGDLRTDSSIEINNFDALDILITKGFIHGSSKPDFWGIKYKKRIKDVTDIIYRLIQPRFKYPYASVVKPTNSKHDILYILLVDYYLDFHDIKGHDMVYSHIVFNKPKKKYLNKNNRKFLPAVLDAYKIKSKYFVGIISSSQKFINISCLNILCKTFGIDYINYIKKIPWVEICGYQTCLSKKSFELRNNIEKNNLVLLSNNWIKNKESMFGFLNNITTLLKMRDVLEKYGYELKFTAKTKNQFEKLEAEWQALMIYHKRGYKLKYNYPSEFIKTIEEPIILNDKKFKIKLLTTEDEFKLEGVIMKNCMSNQFLNGIILTYLYVQQNKKRINLSYQKGGLIQAFGKANTSLPNDFKEVVDVLNERFKKYSNLNWNKERYDVIK